MKLIPATTYGPLRHELNLQAAALRQPLNGIFELTDRCNLFCRMCYVRQLTGTVPESNKELSAEQWLRLAHSAVENGMVFLLLTGGEVFHRPDFFEIYTPLTRLGLVITIFTNATLVTNTIAARLGEAPPTFTEITLYGATSATYESITGIPGSYARCCAGIEALLKHGVPLGLKSTITRQNVGELDLMRQMAHKWGLPYSAGWLLTRRRDGLQSKVEDCRLSAEDCVSLEASDSATATQWMESSLRELPAANPQPANFNCLAGKATFVVNPRGEMNPCLDLTQPAVKPLQIGFRSAWEQIQRFVDCAPGPASICAGCEALAFCPRCPAWSQLETGTLNEPVPYLCGIAWRRKKKYTNCPS